MSGRITTLVPFDKVIAKLWAEQVAWFLVLATGLYIAGCTRGNRFRKQVPPEAVSRECDDCRCCDACPGKQPEQREGQ